jgi:predicted NUDIX family NTP pyrophosphohydrolase
MRVSKSSGGLVVYRRNGDGEIEVFLVHPGGPFWANKDDRAWSIPKGEYEPREDPLVAARREFEEEVGRPAPEGDLLELGEIRQPNGKRVIAWAVPGDVDENAVASNTFELEWPPRSGRMQSFPEVDRGAWFSSEVARKKLSRGQVAFIDRLLAALG